MDEHWDNINRLIGTVTHAGPGPNQFLLAPANGVIDFVPGLPGTAGDFIYPKVDGVSSGVIRKAIKYALSIIDTPKEEFEPGIKDMLTSEVVDKNSIFSRTESFKSIHFPKTIEEFQKARERLALDEFIYLRSIFENLKSEFKNKNKGPKYIFEISLIIELDTDCLLKLNPCASLEVITISSDIKEA